MSSETPEVTESPEVSQITSPHPPTTVVLAKVKGYPAWPAMVLDESILPENIVQKKPKSIRGKASKKGKPAVILPVRFFSDDTYIWISSNDVKVLEKKQVEEFLKASSGKRRRDNLLEFAYQLALDPPDMEMFVKYGSKGSQGRSKDDEVEEEEYEEEDEEEEEEDDEDEGDDEEEEEVTRPRKKARVTKAKKTTKAPKTPKLTKAQERKIAAQKKKDEERKLLAEYDSDWGLDDFNSFNKEDGDYIFDTEEEQRTILEEVPSAAVIQEELAEAHERFSEVADELIEQLLSEERPNEKLVAKKLTEFDKLYHQTPKTVVMKSKLLRVMIVVVRKRDGNEKVRQRVDKTLRQTLDIDVEQNSEADYIEESVEPKAEETKAEEGVEPQAEEGVEPQAEGSVEPKTENGHEKTAPRDSVEPNGEGHSNGTH